MESIILNKVQENVPRCALYVSVNYHLILDLIINKDVKI